VLGHLQETGMLGYDVRLASAEYVPLRVAVIKQDEDRGRSVRYEWPMYINPRRRD